jgi:hypothetical protein
MNSTTKAAIAKYGRGVCAKAFAMHHIDGEGGSTVGIYLGLTTRQADAAINAGEEIFRNEYRIESEALTCSCSFIRYVQANRELIG